MNRLNFISRGCRKKWRNDMTYTCEDCECNACKIKGTKYCPYPCEECNNQSNHCEGCSMKENEEILREINN